MSTRAQSAAAASQKCSYCNGTGRWTKDILVGKPPEMVYCPHCHGSGIGGAAPRGEE